MEEQFDAQRDLDAQLREKESKQLEEFRNKVRNVYVCSALLGFNIFNTKIYRIVVLFNEW